MKQWHDTMKQNWATLAADRVMLLKFVLNFLVCYMLFMLMINFLVRIRFRAGVVLNDPIQQLFTPHDFSFYISLLTYICIITYLLYVIALPRQLYFALRAFLAVFLIRALFIYLVPLAPPPKMIFLKDPFVEFVIGSSNILLNDLFYSGHAAAMTLFVLCCTNIWLRIFMTVICLVVSLLLVWQHVHYTADIVAAPFFAYVCYAFFVKNR